ncbi:hypothetical protein HNR76_002160 [Pseudoxanthomonas broegbernensis]|nr:hypothetical protein [Pseudoxanthomonas broegbernensis]
MAWKKIVSHFLMDEDEPFSGYLPLDAPPR